MSPTLIPSAPSSPIWTGWLQDLRQELDPDAEPADDRPTPLPGAELSWQEWVRRKRSGAASRPMGDHHKRAWEWFEALEAGVKPPALVECWFRGGGKSTTVELCLGRQAVLARRRFALYVSSTQKAANRHVQAVGSTMEKVGIQRAVNQYGFSKGWTADLLRTSNGFNILSLGLDAAVRGVKLDEFRPDIILLDDIDEMGDSIEVVADKVQVLTQSILQAGSIDVAVAFFQNAIHQHSIMSGVLNRTLDLLLRRIQSPPVPAVENLKYEKIVLPEGGHEYKITGGTANWAGKPLEVCEAEINDSGLVSFLRESQHDTGVGGRFFDDWDVKRHVLLDGEVSIEKHWHRFGGYDWGFGKPCCFLLGVVVPWGGVILLDEEYHTQLTNPEQATKVLECLQRNGLTASQVDIWADPSMWAMKADRITGKRSADVEAFHSKGLRFLKANNNRRHGWNNMRRYLRDGYRPKGDDGKPDPDVVPIPFLRALQGKCPNFIRTMPMQVFDPTDVEDLDTDGEDHSEDAARYMLASKPRPSGPDPNAPKEPDHTPSWYRNRQIKKERKL